MVAAAKISNKLGFCKKEIVEMHEQVLKENGLPIKIPKYIKLRDIHKVLLSDKKEREQTIPFVLLEEVERVRLLMASIQCQLKEKLLMIY